MTNLMTIVSYQPQLPPALDESGQITMTDCQFWIQFASPQDESDNGCNILGISCGLKLPPMW